MALLETLLTAASPGGQNILVDGSNAPPGISVDVGLAAKEHGPTEVHGAIDVGSDGTGAAPMWQSAILYPLFYHENVGWGW
jgi:hypothetical protein